MLKSLKELNRSLDREELSHKKTKCNYCFFFQSNISEFREECIFIFLTQSFSNRVPNNTFENVQMLAT